MTDDTGYVPLRTASRLSSRASTSGAGDALDLLERDHRIVESLFAYAALTEGPLRQVAVEAIRHELTNHATLEERVVYPAIGEALAAGGALIDRSIDDHDDMRALLNRLRSFSPEDPAALEDLRQLQLIVQQHVALEEAEVFPLFRQLADRSARRELDEAAATARAAAPPPPSEQHDGLLHLIDPTPTATPTTIGTTS